MPLDPNPDVAELMRYSGVRRPKPPPVPDTPLLVQAPETPGCLVESMAVILVIVVCAATITIAVVL